MHTHNSDRTVDTGTDASQHRWSIDPWLRVLWSYRWVLAISSLVLLIATVTLLGLAMFTAPTDRIAAANFRLTFDGAATGNYPNKTAFSFKEIVSEAVLTEVFQQNDLKRYTSIGEFGKQVYVLQTNPQIEILDMEYQARLSDARLTPPERVRLETEYENRRSALMTPDYVLYFRRSDAVSSMPDALIFKVMQDVLAVWARQAVERKGALRYDIPIVTHATLSTDDLAKQDYIVAADMLRAYAYKLLRSIDRIAQLPGATVVRAKTESLSLAEIRSRIEDEQRFHVQPLLEFLCASGLTRDSRSLEFYVSSQLAYAKQRLNESTQRARAFDEPLRTYLGTPQSPVTPSGRPGGASDSTALPPQLSDAFLDRVIRMAKQAEDVEFRQKLTRDLVAENLNKAELEREVAFYEGLQRLRPGTGGGREGALAWVSAQTTTASGALNSAGDQAFELYSEVSAHNLSPEVGLFAMTSPFRVQTFPSFSLKRAGLMLSVATLLILLLVPAGCLIHHRVRHLSRP